MTTEIISEIYDKYKNIDHEKLKPQDIGDMIKPYLTKENKKSFRELNEKYLLNPYMFSQYAADIIHIYITKEDFFEIFLDAYNRVYVENKYYFKFEDPDVEFAYLIYMSIYH